MDISTAYLEGPCTKWTDDCQGKKDYDGRLVSISTRYWSARFGSRDGLCSAVSAIVLNHGIPNEYGYGNYTVLVEKEFEAQTKQEVKRLVEDWVKIQYERIIFNLATLLTEE